MSDQQQQDAQPYAETAASHIRTLSTLSTRLPALLTTTATTLSQLTNAPIPLPSAHQPPNASSIPDTPALRRAALSTTANAFFSAVLDLSSALHAQIDELEKHGVIPAEEVGFRAIVQGAPGAGSTKPRDSQASVTNNGLGNFDVGVLNAKAGVRRKEGDEVLSRVQEILRGMAGDEERQGGDEDMKDG